MSRWLEGEAKRREGSGVQRQLEGREGNGKEHGRQGFWRCSGSSVAVPRHINGLAVRPGPPLVLPFSLACCALLRRLATAGACGLPVLQTSRPDGKAE